MAVRSFRTVQGLSIIKPPYGRITAYDMNKGTIAWQIANGDTPANVKNHPALQGLTIPRTGSARHVGLLVTKTLLFAGDGTNPLLHAYDKKTGEDIAQIPMPGMQTGVPMTYVHQGRQFILVAGGRKCTAGTTAQLVAYALPHPAVAAAVEEAVVVAAVLPARVRNLALSRTAGCACRWWSRSTGTAID